MREQIGSNPLWKTYRSDHYMDPDRELTGLGKTVRGAIAVGVLGTILGAGYMMSVGYDVVVNDNAEDYLPHGPITSDQLPLDPATPTLEPATATFEPSS